MSNSPPSRCGYVALLGRPNVGKSTLLNRLVGQKISITSRKPQTTRNQILGIVSDAEYQIVFVDTPGIQGTHDSAMHRYMNRAAVSTVQDVDAIVFLLDRLEWTEEDQRIVRDLEKVSAPVILAINKIDRIVDKNRLLPHIQALSSSLHWSDIVPLSAKSGHNVDELVRLIRKRLPEREFLFDPEQVTDRSERFLAAELIREKIMRQMGDELPHKTAIEIEEFKDEPGLSRISAIIWVEREGQKKIIVGRGGEKLKTIGSEARRDIEQLIDRKVMLNLWVKVKGSWSDDDRMLRQLGYSDQ